MAPVAKSLRILVVDDFFTLRRIIRNTLKQLGFKDIIDVSNASSAISILNKDKIDLIICDMEMPQTSGLELLKTIRSSNALKKIRFILLVLDTNRDIEKEAEISGADACIVKPLTADSLGISIENIFNKSV